MFAFQRGIKNIDFPMTICMHVSSYFIIIIGYFQHPAGVSNTEREHTLTVVVGDANCMLYKPFGIRYIIFYRHPHRLLRHDG
jgi:hypothetical protein